MVPPLNLGVIQMLKRGNIIPSQIRAMCHRRGLFTAVAPAVMFCTACSQQDALEGNESARARPTKSALELSSAEWEAHALIVKASTAREAEEKLRKTVSEAMAEYLFDPKSAQYRNLRSGRNGAICGEVNGKNKYGAYVGFKDFVLAANGSDLDVSASSDGVRSSPFGEFAEAYLSSCASAKERNAHASATDVKLNSGDEGWVNASEVDVNMEVNSDDPFAN